MRNNQSCCSCSSMRLKKKHIINGYNIYECEQCRLLITNVSKSHDIRKFNKDYYSQIYLENYSARAKCLTSRFLARLKDIENYKKCGGNLLDIGCSTGLFLKTVSENSRYKWSLFGIDMNQKAIDFAKTSVNAKLYHTSLTNARLKDGFFDCITCFDVLEHDFNINKNLQLIKRALKKDGLLVIQLPNHRSLMAYVCGDNWDWWSVPDHVLHFFPSVLLQILKENGFIIRRVFTWEPAKEFVENIRGTIKKEITSFMSLNRILGKLSVVPLYFLWSILRPVEMLFPVGGLSVVYAMKQ